MVQLKHYRGISERIKPSKGGPSQSLRKLARRPEGNYHANARMSIVPRYKCDKCSETAHYSSTVDGEVEYRLCEKCFKKRYEKTKNRKL
jgi:hypothetical protein